MSEFSGYDVGAATGSTTSPNVENKTNKASNTSDTEETRFLNQSKQQVVQVGGGNVLNNFRSVTYSFTLSALTKSEVNNPDSYRDSELNLVILKSGGKGNSGIALSNSFFTAAVAPAAGGGRGGGYVDRNYGKEFLEGFNTTSPGRFDMFIENIEIESLMAFAENSNSSLPCKVKFDVIEPFSVNGFIEALHVSSVAAGYPNYISASFLLKMEFWGYPDDDIEQFKSPVQIPNSTRHFPIGITGIEVDITERGTRYAVSAVPYNERAFGNPSVVKKPIKMAGSSVGSILRNLIDNINSQVKRIDTEGRVAADAKKSDEYAIKFVEWDTSKGWVEPAGKETAISKSELSHLYRDNNLYKMADPGSSDKPDGYQKNGSKQPTAQEQANTPEKIKYNPSAVVIQFAEGMNIHDIITSVIRDSEYARGILQNIKSKIDEFGMLEYFMVRIEVTNLDVIDEISKKPYQRYTYVVSPYRLHYTKIPPYGSQQIEEKTLKKLSLREYNYIYTGQNIDVLSFKLNFNTLFFEAVPSAMGNNDIASSKTGTGPSSHPTVKLSGVDVERQQANQLPLSPTKITPVPVQYTGSNGSQMLDDPYSLMARIMHESIINSKASLLTGEIEILGDPIFVATNGTGNYNGKPEGKGTTSGGEANHLYSEILITINFRNPIDILGLDQGGVMQFDANRVPFSGVYRVNKAINTFKDGIFKQRLEVIRVPGQILDQNLKPTNPLNVLKNEYSFDDNVQADSTRATPSQRLSDTAEINQLQRGYPSTGLPGESSNYTNSPGNLGGTDSSLLNRTYGLVSRSGALITNSSPIGQALPTDVASSIRLNSSGLASLAQTNLGSAALIAIASNVITGGLPINRAVGVIAGSIAGSAINSILRKNNKGSGIGQGATVSINNDVVSAANATAQDELSGKTISSSSLPSGSINQFTSSLKTLGTDSLDAVTNTAKNIGKFANNIGDNISKLNASSADPNAIAAGLGINTSALSGLSTLSSKALTNIQNLIKNTPSNVDLKQAVDSGLLLQNIPSNKIKNIPATQPFSKAPDPIIDAAYVKSVVANKGLRGLENLYGVTNLDKVPSSAVTTDIIKSATSNATLNPFTSLNSFKNPIDATVLTNKLATAADQVSSLTGIPSIKDSNFSKAVGSRFGSASIGSSPLDKLVNKLNDPSAPPYLGNDPIIRKRLGLPPI